MNLDFLCVVDVVIVIYHSIGYYYSEFFLYHWLDFIFLFIYCSTSFMTENGVRDGRARVKQSQRQIHIVSLNCFSSVLSDIPLNRDTFSCEFIFKAFFKHIYIYLYFLFQWCCPFYVQLLLVVFSIIFEYINKYA